VNLPATTAVAPKRGGPADVERLLVSTQRRKSPNLRVGATITLDDAVQKVTAVVKDLQGTVLVRS
jgi:hypothetical protein